MTSPPAAPEGWPRYPETDAEHAELAKIVYEAEVGLEKAKREDPPRTATTEELFKAQYDTENELFKNFHETLREIAKGSATRADTLAQLIQAAAGVIVTLYTGLLGLVFAAGGHPLPTRALIPGLFLGAAVALSTAYVAFLTRVRNTDFRPDSRPRANALAQTAAILNWVRHRVERRQEFIRSAVVSLALGVLFLPSAFVTLAEPPSLPALTTSTSPPSTLVAWPPPPVVQSSAETEIAKVRYQAEVNEVVAQRQQQLQPSAPRAPRMVDLGQAGKYELIEDVLWGAALALALVLYYRATHPEREPPSAEEVAR